MHGLDLTDTRAIDGDSINTTYTIEIARISIEGLSVTAMREQYSKRGTSYLRTNFLVSDRSPLVGVGFPLRFYCFLCVSDVFLGCDQS